MTLADRYALISQEIEQLEATRKELREQLLALNSNVIEGNQCTVTITTRETVTLDPKTVYDCVKPSRFFQMVSVKPAEARKVLSEEEYSAAIKKITEASVVLVKHKVAAIIG